MRCLLRDRHTIQEKLTKKEMQVFKLIAMGYRMRDIENMLGISRSGGSQWRMRILQKMDWTANHEIVAYAWRNGIVK